MRAPCPVCLDRDWLSPVARGLIENLIASGARKHTREAGAMPARSRHCMWEATLESHWTSLLRSGKESKALQL